VAISIVIEHDEYPQLPPSLKHVANCSVFPFREETGVSNCAQAVRVLPRNFIARNGRLFSRKI